MAKVLGIGGVFFKSKDPEKLSKWYEKWLGFEVDPDSGVLFHPERMPENAVTVWSPFADDTDYFAPSGKDFMLNLVVDDLEGALSQVAEGGASLIGTMEEYEYGRFGRFMDPEGNKIELWEPAHK
jgi:predicted enzyme related to lactoylglutathione lyase